MATEFLNDARKEIEGRTADFYGALKAFYQGNGEAEQKLRFRLFLNCYIIVHLYQFQPWIG